MLKPPNIPGAGVVTDTLDFVKNLWGAMNVPGVTSFPGMAAPTLSVEELDKKINDLKAVEAWLNLNMGMLRGSIQALEVQRGTIATLKSMGATLSNAVRPGTEGGERSSEKSLLESIPYASAFLFPNANPVPTTPDEMEANIVHEPPAPEPEVGAEKKEPNVDLGAQIAQAGAWWGMLQEQFKQAVASALATDGSKPAAESKPKASSKAKPAAAASKPATAKKPAAKTASKVAKPRVRKAS